MKKQFFKVVALSALFSLPFIVKAQIQISEVGSGFDGIIMVSVTVDSAFINHQVVLYDLPSSLSIGGAESEDVLDTLVFDNSPGGFETEYVMPPGIQIGSQITGWVQSATGDSVLVQGYDEFTVGEQTVSLEETQNAIESPKVTWLQDKQILLTGELVRPTTAVIMDTQGRSIRFITIATLPTTGLQVDLSELSSGAYIIILDKLISRFIL